MKIISLQVLILCVATIAATLLTWKFHPSAPALYLTAEPVKEGEVSITDALKWEADGGVIWLDARKQEAFEKDHIPGAILLNEFDFNRLFRESFHLIANQERPIVVYCGSESCKTSAKIADELRAKMIPDVYVLKGGWQAWVSEKRG